MILVMQLTLIIPEAQTSELLIMPEQFVTTATQDNAITTYWNQASVCNPRIEQPSQLFVHPPISRHQRLIKLITFTKL